ncbi:C40 family peptidase [Pseudomonas sp. NW5]|uniref:C40 family peptidase n=1 Tax=Pseudomonas sp. NW5 TaxID=2934934 RepID=UPI0020200840|nr:C40 family peptidase [Pseudomonas sp. NW5]MCL7461682.1 C40 family peptidase [Pseudomonas sp. NW5]
MRLPVRLCLIACLLLLGACASKAPPQAPQAVRALPSSGVAENVLMHAIGLVGTPYRWGGNTPDSGFDCSGLIGYVYRNAADLQLPRTTREMNALPVPPVARTQLRSGDLLFFATAGGRAVSHAGIYVGDGRFVHAPRAGGTVRLERLDSQYWQRAYLGARRVLAAGQLASNP